MLTFQVLYMPHMEHVHNIMGVHVHNIMGVHVHNIMGVHVHNIMGVHVHCTVCHMIVVWSTAHRLS